MTFLTCHFLRMKLLKSDKHVSTQPRHEFFGKCKKKKKKKRKKTNKILQVGFNSFLEMNPRINIDTCHSFIEKIEFVPLCRLLSSTYILLYLCPNQAFCVSLALRNKIPFHFEPFWTSRFALVRVVCGCFSRLLYPGNAVNKSSALQFSLWIKKQFSSKREIMPSH